MYRTYGSRVTHGAVTEEQLSRANDVGGLLQNTSCVLPFRPAIKQLFNFAPGKISLVTLLWLLTKFVRNKLERALLGP